MRPRHRWLRTNTVPGTSDWLRDVLTERGIVRSKVDAGHSKSGSWPLLPVEEMVDGCRQAIRQWQIMANNGMGGAGRGRKR